MDLSSDRKWTCPVTENRRFLTCRFVFSLFTVIPSMADTIIPHYHTTQHYHHHHHRQNPAELPRVLFFSINLRVGQENTASHTSSCARSCWKALKIQKKGRGHDKFQRTAGSSEDKEVRMLTHDQIQRTAGSALSSSAVHAVYVYSQVQPQRSRKAKDQRKIRATKPLQVSK